MSRHTDRAESLLGKMRLGEKVAQLYAVWLRIEEDGSFAFRGVNDGFIEVDTADPREIIKDGIGQITRPLGTRAIDARKGVRGLNLVQKFLIEHTRLGVPALAHEECLPGLMAKGATLFPAGINFGSLWDEELMARIAGVIGDELESVGARQGLAPVLDVSRDVRWGRTEESFGEDPYLAGCMAVAYVRGLQGPERRVLATLKHFVGHSGSEGGRNHAPVHVGERELSDLFLLPFEMAVKLANAGSVMPAYHDIDGEPASSSRRYLTELLRGQWGFDGIVVSDYRAINLLYHHHRVAREEAEASALALRAGMDVELPGFTCFRTGIEKALDRGLLEPAEVDAAVKRVLVEKSRLGLFERPYADEGAIVLNSPDHARLAEEAALRSIVLLRNDGILPLAPGGATALIGPLADDPLAGLSGYSFPAHLILTSRAESGTRWTKTLREALAEWAGSGTLLYAPGCAIVSDRPREAPVFPGDVGSGTSTSPVSHDESGIAEAVALASTADRIVVAVGDIAGLFLSGTVGEGSDASSLKLPGVQEKLLDGLLDLGKPTIVVLFNGRPYNLGSAYRRANAVVEAWLPGQGGAQAVARILAGKASPGGRLPVSVPKSAGAMPYYYNHKLKAGGTPVQPDFGALYPFGFGLTYTTFAYGDFSVERTTVPIDGEIRLSCVVRNTGVRDGEEVVQLYVRDLYASLVRPVKELKGFRRISLAAGAALRVRFALPVDMLNFTIAGTTRVVEPGEFEVMIGSSSEDIKFTSRVDVSGELRTLPARWRMQCETSAEPV